MRGPLWLQQHTVPRSCLRALQFIFIRNRKAASTTVTDQFEKCSYKVADPLLCIEEATVEQFAARGLDLAKAWKEYFVFSTARNPWARAGSSYDYCSEKWLVRVSGCHRCVHAFGLG